MFDEPLFFKPIMIERVWGGCNLETLHGKAIPAGKIIGESWEVSDRPEAQSVVEGGEFDGWTLRQLLEKYPREILGDLPDTVRFPLLVKYVDAGDKLSVQVHPDDDGATIYNDLGKSECWVVIHAEPGAQIVRGLEPGTTRAMFEQAIKEDRVEELLHYFEPRPGDVIALPPGMVHAIGKGLIVAEVQQNSDVTLRIYDYKRMGLDGRLRKLHVDEALNAIRFGEPGTEFAGDMFRDTVAPSDLFCGVDGLEYETLLIGKYFDLHRFTLPADKVTERGTEITCGEFPNHSHTARVAMVIAGSGLINDRPVRAGMTALIPACAENISACGPMTVLLATPK